MKKKIETTQSNKQIGRLTLKAVRREVYLLCNSLYVPDNLRADVHNQIEFWVRECYNPKWGGALYYYVERQTLFHLMNVFYDRGL